MLSAMGMPTAFSGRADFSGISNGNLPISKVIHKTKISVTQEGTKASAATGAIMSGIIDNASKNVTLSRPFVYMIIDTETMLPLFAGVYTGV